MPDEHTYRPGLDAILSDPDAVGRATETMRRIAIAIVGDHASSEDVVQSAWVELLQRRGGGTGLGWMRALVRSRALDALRTHAREGARALELARHAGQSDPLGAEVELQRVVLEAVEALAEPYRGAVYLRYFEGLGPSAIARRTGTPRRTVETRLTRAHGMLRERLRSRYCQDGESWSPAFLAFAGGLPALPREPLSSLAFGLLMNKVVLVAASALLVVLVGWIALRNEPAEPSAPQTAAAEREPSIELRAPSEPGAAIGPEPRAAVSPLEPHAEDGVASAIEAGSLRVRVLRSTLDPAESVHVIATKNLGASPVPQRLRRPTDAAGVAEFQGLRPGTYSVQTDRDVQWNPRTIEVGAGAPAELVITLSGGLHVLGSVREPDGLPIAGAEIWLTSSTGGWTSGGAATETDESGQFELFDVPAGQSLGALAAGYRASELSDLDLRDPEQNPIAVELVVEPGGARLEGRVQDANGEPLPDIVLALGKASDVRNRRIDGSHQERWGPRATRSNAAGKFSFEAVEPGEHALRTRGGEFAGWFGIVSIEERATTRQDVTLRRGGQIQGQVRTAEGSVVPGALVHALSEELREGHLQNGQLDSDSPFHHPVAVADQDGRFLVENITPGTVNLVAREPAPEDRDRGRAYRYTTSTLALDPGETATWNPELSDGRVIEGVAEYADGSPITNHYVILSGESVDSERVQLTSDGSFRFIRLPDEAFAVRVQMWSKPPSEREPRLEGVRPDTGPIRVVADFAAPAGMPSALVRIQFVDAGERVLRKAAVALEDLDDITWRLGEQDDDGWTFRVDERGSYRPLVFDGERIVAMGESFDLLGGEDLDLGVLYSKPGASLALRFERPADDSVEGVMVKLSVGGANWSEILELDAREEWRLEGLEPGEAELALIGGNVVNRRIPMELVAGTETVVDVPLEPAALVPYRIGWDAAPSGESLAYQFVDLDSGEVADEFEMPDLHEYTSPVAWTARLPLGSYALEVDFSTLPDRRIEFEVTSLDPRMASVVSLE